MQSRRHLARTSHRGGRPGRLHHLDESEYGRRPPRYPPLAVIVAPQYIPSRWYVRVPTVLCCGRTESHGMTGIMFFVYAFHTAQTEFQKSEVMLSVQTVRHHQHPLPRLLTSLGETHLPDVCA